MHCKVVGATVLPRICYTARVKFTQYFQFMRQRPDRASIKLEWIQRVIDDAEREVVQTDGRVRLWAAIPEAEGKYLRVILLPDRETVHNAFFDRRFVP
jgi:hypothetical protein